MPDASAIAEGSAPPTSADEPAAATSSVIPVALVGARTIDGETFTGSLGADDLATIVDQLLVA